MKYQVTLLFIIEFQISNKLSKHLSNLIKHYKNDYHARFERNKQQTID